MRGFVNSAALLVLTFALLIAVSSFVFIEADLHSVAESGYVVENVRWYGDAINFSCRSGTASDSGYDSNIGIFDSISKSGDKITAKFYSNDLIDIEAEYIKNYPPTLLIDDIVASADAKGKYSLTITFIVCDPEGEVSFDTGLGEKVKPDFKKPKLEYKLEKDSLAAGKYAFWASAYDDTTQVDLTGVVDLESGELVEEDDEKKDDEKEDDEKEEKEQNKFAPTIELSTGFFSEKLGQTATYDFGPIFTITDADGNAITVDAAFTEASQEPRITKNGDQYEILLIDLYTYENLNPFWVTASDGEHETCVSGVIDVSKMPPEVFLDGNPSC